VTSGVPQGSYLGPLCFIWFVNRISEIFDYIRVLFYADDMDEEMTFSEHLDVMVVKAFAMLGLIRRLSLEFRDPYTLKSLYTSLVCPKLEYADREERVQRRFIRYALRSLSRLSFIHSFIRSLIVSSDITH
jgi:hypothetical protein